MRKATALVAAIMVLSLIATSGASASKHHVLLVGKTGTYKTIQAAVNAAHSGDWILIAPGDYKGAVYITKSNLHLRGMSRTGVIVDGTKSGPACSSKAKDQDFKRGDKGNGIEIWKANGVSVENLTVCNFLGEGNQVWWNGGDGSGKIGMTTYHGAFLSATSTYFNAKKPQATYGLFVSNARGPGDITDSYGTNMNDAAFYVGACAPCNSTLDRDKGEFNTLGYSGTNSSKVLIQNSEFNDNFTGISTDSENNDDAPPPQLGSTFKNNYVHDNNNPNVPSKPEGLRIVGVGIITTGGRHNRISGNRVENNGAWGIVAAPFPDTRIPPKVAHCQGGVAQPPQPDGTVSCYFDDWDNQVFGNKFKNNGFFGNPTNADMLDISGQNNQGNCWHDNVRADGSAATSDPTDLQATHATCGVPNHGDDLFSEAASQAICDSELTGPCATDATHNYPRTTQIKVHKLPKLRGMKNPCAGVPANKFCSGKGVRAARR